MSAPFGAIHSDTLWIVGDGPDGPLVRLGGTSRLPLLVSRPRELDREVARFIVAAVRFAQPS